MSKEEKLKRLLEQAHQHWWRIDLTKNPQLILFAKLLNGTCDIKHCELKSTTLYYSAFFNDVQVMYQASLNDLVTELDNNERTFIEALCIASSHLPSNSGLDSDVYFLDVLKIIHRWLVPDSERIDILFKIFKHLI